MKVCIATIFNVSNYGTVLQAYATQKIIERYGCEVEIINYITKQRTISRKLFWSPDRYKENPLLRLLYILSRFPNNIYKTIIFRRFQKKWLKLSKRKYITIQDLVKNPPQADIYLTGSDQVWNSDYNEGIDYGFFLDFGDESKIRCSYAASLGMEHIPASEIDEYKRLLEKYRIITVREQMAVDELNKIEFKSEIVLDPTLVVKKDEWISIGKNNMKLHDYILVMVLYGEDCGIPDIAKKISEETNSTIVELCWNPFNHRKWKTIYGKSPEEFISFVNNAKFIITNSFHVTAFSINFGKQFIAVKREKYNNRISSLLNLFGLENRYISDFKNYEIYKETIDYVPVYEKLENMRRKSWNMIEEILRQTDE